MNDGDTQKQVSRRQIRRHERAMRLRARTLSPLRILMSLLAIPVLAVLVAFSLYIRTSPYPPSEATLHLMARFGCETARSVGLASARRGELGYHSRNDVDEDGVACTGFEPSDTLTIVAQPKEVQTHSISGAKFVKP